MNARLVILMLICCGVLLMTQSGAETTETFEPIELQHPCATVAQTSHDPIVITSNQDFIDQGWPGAGTEGDPFRIEDLEIVNNSVGISISDTTAYFEINGCVISSVSETGVNPGIIFDNVTHGSIYSSVVTNRTNGVYLAESYNCTLDSIISSSNGNQGFYLSSSTNCTLTHNTASANGEYGFLLYQSTNCTLTNNTASSNDYGILLSQSSECNIYYNILFDNTINAHDGGNTNDWDDGVLGNYYDDFSGTGTYSINGATGSVDHHPYHTSAYFSVTIDHPLDLAYELGSTGHSITWTCADPYPDSYCIYQNGSVVSSGIWNGSALFISVDGLGIGNHNFTLEVYDLEGHRECDTVWVFVRDSVSPTITSPIDRSYELGSTGNELLWTPEDLNPASYTVLRNGSSIESGDWTGSAISVDIDGLAVGVYNYTLVVYDEYDHWNSDTVLVSVHDTTAPTITSPNDCSYEYGVTGNELLWTPEDLNPDSYAILRNGSVIRSGDWTGSTISLNVDGLNVGVYNYTVIVYDESENWISDTIMVSVHDNIPPSINHPADSYYEYGTVGTKIYWSPSDLNPASYAVLQNGTSVESGTWFGSSITVDVDGLAVGEYNYTVVLYDESENWISDTVLVSVQDTTSPTINNPSDSSYEYGSTGNQIIWDSDDLLPASYTVMQNGTSIQSNTWDGSSITVNIDGLDIGIYNYTISVYDQSGNSISDTVMVIVISSNPPSIDSPADSSYECGTTGNEIIWTPNDLQPDSYIILQNGITVESDTWDGSSINVDVDGLAVGIYNFTACVYDKSGNSASDTVILEVVDRTLPTIDHPVDSSYEYGITGNQITWHPLDLNSESYALLRNDTVIRSGAWAGSPITIDIDGLDVGTYNYTICVYDESGNSISDTVMVTVTDNGASTPAENTPLGNPVVVGGIALTAVGAVLIVGYVIRRYIQNK
ncbi:MAG: hypothetical protein GF411_19020 [Candidatus Lokiarchaeota archaeon]|nr:hypothetical protein [Candidatus Lokiarchaeota archaeon]